MLDATYYLVPRDEVLAGSERKVTVSGAQSA